MKLIYICSPFAGQRDAAPNVRCGGDVEDNILKARRYCRFAMSQGELPFAPHLIFPQFLDDSDPAERQAGLNMGLSVLGYCSELWSFGSEVTPGMASEIEWAEKLKIPVRRFTAACEEVFP